MTHIDCRLRVVHIFLIKRYMTCGYLSVNVYDVSVNVYDVSVNVYDVSVNVYDVIIFEC